MIAAYRTVATNRRLIRLFTGEFISGIGDWLYLVALLVVVYRESSDPFLLGVIGGARILPYVLLSVPAGIMVDRFDRRVVLIATDSIRALVMVALAINTFLDGPVLLTVGLAIFATIFAVFFGPAMGAYMPSLVRNESELGPANSVAATLGEITFIIGPAIAGLIIATTDLGWAFVINALSFLAPVLILWTLPPNDPRKAGAAATTDDHPGADGATATPSSAPTITARSILRPFGGRAVLEVVSGFLWGGLSVALVIFAVDQLGASEDATGYLWAAIGAGGVLGAVASSSIVLRPDLGPVLMLGTVILAVGFIVLGAVDTLAAALFACAFLAAGALLSQVVGETVLQRVVPDAIRGRAIGTMQTLGTTTYAAGSFAVPILMTTVGAQPILTIGGIAILLAGVVTYVLVGSHFQRPERLEATAEVLGRVSRLPLFAGVSPAALEVATSRLVPVEVSAGTSVVREGDPADRFYIIESGEFVVDQRDPTTGEDHRLRTLGPDDVFGELGLMHRAPRSATVTATSAGRLLALDGPDFLRLLDAEPEVSGRMLDRYRGAAAPRG
ncbi:MAG: MFS transporter [Candidatus Limnocylindria bacterium]